MNANADLNSTQREFLWLDSTDLETCDDMQYLPDCPLERGFESLTKDIFFSLHCGRL